MTLQNVLHKFCCPRSLHSQQVKYLKKPDSYRISSSHFQISAITEKAASITLDRSPPLQQLNAQICLGAWASYRNPPTFSSEFWIGKSQPAATSGKQL